MANRGQAGLHLPLLQGVDQCDNYSGSAVSYRMSDGYRTSIDVELFRVNSQLISDDYRCDRKCLIVLNQIEVTDLGIAILKVLPRARYRSLNEIT